MSNGNGDSMVDVDGGLSTPPGQYITIQGLKIHYEKLGVGSQAVLLLPGGLGSTRTDFDPQLRLMDKKKYTLVAWDAPGYGYSRPPDRNYDSGAQLYHQDAQLAAELMQVSSNNVWKDADISCKQLIMNCLMSK